MDEPVGDNAKRSDEQAAAELVAAHCGRPVRETVSRGGTGEHDYDLVLEDSSVIALEVTQAIVGAEIAAWKGLNDPAWSNPQKVTCHWHVSVAKAPSIKGLKMHLEENLVVLECAGVFAINLRHWDGCSSDHSEAVREAAKQIFALGIQRVTGWPGTDPLISFGSGTVGVTAPDLVNAALEVEANKQDNTRKLHTAAAAGSEGHLFVWIDSTKVQASAALSFGFLPEAPDLPPGVTTAWVALAKEAWDVRQLWRVTPPGPWEVVVGGPSG
jgi:hypothetical protein